MRWATGFRRTWRPLPIGIEDPAERLRRVSQSMGDLKESKQAVGATLMTELADFAPPTIAGQAARLQSRQRFFNLVVTNVPGPQFPLFLMGRRLQSVFPMVPLAKRQAVCFGIMSYDGEVNFGLIGDYDALTDLDALTADLEASLAELGASRRPRSAPRRDAGSGAEDRRWAEHPPEVRSLPRVKRVSFRAAKGSLSGIGEDSSRGQGVWPRERNTGLKRAAMLAAAAATIAGSAIFAVGGASATTARRRAPP